MLFNTRYLGPEIYGQVSWAIALVTTFNSISDFGFSAAHIKRVSEGRDVNDCVSTFIAIKTSLTVAMLVGTLSYIAVLFYGLHSISQADVDVLLLIIAYYVFSNLTAVVWVTYEAQMESMKSNLVYIADPAFRTPLMILVSINQMDAIALAMTYVAGGIGMAAVGWFLFSREHFKFVKPTLYRPYLVYASAIALITIFGTISWNLDKLVIEAFGSVRDVGYYSSTQTLLGVVGFIGIAVTSLTFPAFSGLHREGNIKEIRNITRLAEKYISVLATPITVVLVLFPREVVVLFLGETFSPSAEAMRILALSTYIMLLCQAYTPQIGGINRPELSAKIVGINLLINVILLLILVPSTLAGMPMLGMGFVGAAVANLIISITLTIMVRYTVYHLIRTPFNPRILLHFLAAFISGGTLFALAQFAPVLGWLDLILYSLLELALFYLVLAAFRELTKGDISYIMEVINPKKMASYVKDEMKTKK